MSKIQFFSAARPKWTGRSAKSRTQFSPGRARITTTTERFTRMGMVAFASSNVASAAVGLVSALPPSWGSKPNVEGILTTQNARMTVEPLVVRGERVGTSEATALASFATEGKSIGAVTSMVPTTFLDVELIKADNVHHVLYDLYACIKRGAAVCKCLETVNKNCLLCNARKLRSIIGGKLDFLKEYDTFVANNIPILLKRLDECYLGGDNNKREWDDAAKEAHLTTIDLLLSMIKSWRGRFGMRGYYDGCALQKESDEQQKLSLWFHIRDVLFYLGRCSDGQDRVDNLRLCYKTHVEPAIAYIETLRGADTITTTTKSELIKVLKTCDPSSDPSSCTKLEGLDQLSNFASSLLSTLPDRLVETLRTKNETSTTLPAQQQPKTGQTNSASLNKQIESLLPPLSQVEPSTDAPLEDSSLFQKSPSHDSPSLSLSQELPSLIVRQNSTSLSLSRQSSSANVSEESPSKSGAEKLLSESVTQESSSANVSENSLVKVPRGRAPNPPAKTDRPASAILPSNVRQNSTSLSLSRQSSSSSVSEESPSKSGAEKFLSESVTQESSSANVSENSSVKVPRGRAPDPPAKTDRAASVILPSNVRQNSTSLSLSRQSSSANVSEKSLVKVPRGRAPDPPAKTKELPSDTGRNTLEGKGDKRKKSPGRFRRAFKFLRNLGRI